MATIKSVDMAGLNCVVQVGSFQAKKGDFSIATDYVRRLAVERPLNADDLKRVQRDCEILAIKLRDKPEEIATILQEIFANDLDRARQVAQRIGLTEQEFTKEGGGLMWLVVVVILLYATDAY
jgi:hypothetical protein